MSRLHHALGCGLAALGITACAPVDGAGDEAGAQVSELVSDSRVFIVSVDARVRSLCREQINRFYCDTDTAEQAAAECLSELSLRGASDACADGGAGCLRYEIVNEPCAGTRDIYPTAASCGAPVPNDCSFYSGCVENNIPCGEDGYALGYGERYCTAFKNASFSPRGEAWVASVMGCLQQALIPYSSAGEELATCDEIQSYAFDSHPACYTDPLNSICFLPPSDVLKVMSTIGGREVFTARTLKQMRSVIWTCLGDIGEKIFGAHGAGAPAPSQPMRLWASGGPLPGPAVADRELAAQYQLWLDLDRQYAAAPGDR